MAAAWPPSKAPRSDRQERAWIAHVLHDGHGATIGQVAAALGYEADTASRLVRDGRLLAASDGQPVRVPRVFALGCDPAPTPPFAYTTSQPPTRFHWSHPEPRALSWVEDGATVIVTPLLESPWEEWDPVSRRWVPVSRAG